MIFQQIITFSWGLTHIISKKLLKYYIVSIENYVLREMLWYFFSGRSSVGQNVATSWTTAKTPAGLEDLVETWYDEVELFDSHQVEHVT